MATLLDETRRHFGFSSYGYDGVDSFFVDVPEGEVFDRCQVTIVEKHFNAGVNVISQPVSGQAGVVQVIVRWW